jgi:hypothetical protein
MPTDILLAFDINKLNSVITYYYGINCNLFLLIINILNKPSIDHLVNTYTFCLRCLSLSIFI